MVLLPSLLFIAGVELYVSLSPAQRILALAAGPLLDADDDGLAHVFFARFPWTWN